MKKINKINTHMVEKKMQSIEIIDRMSKDQIRNYWYELKQMRYDGYYFRELYEKILKMNPNLVLPDQQEITKIEKDALSIAFWEENWEISNERRVKSGGVDYSILKNRNTKRDTVSVMKSRNIQRKVV
jgi:hypothetical protein